MLRCFIRLLYTVHYVRTFKPEPCTTSLVNCSAGPQYILVCCNIPALRLSEKSREFHQLAANTCGTFEQLWIANGQSSCQVFVATQTAYDELPVCPSFARVGMTTIAWQIRCFRSRRLRGTYVRFNSIASTPSTHARLWAFQSNPAPLKPPHCFTVHVPPAAC